MWVGGVKGWGSLQTRQNRRPDILWLVWMKGYTGKTRGRRMSTTGASYGNTVQITRNLWMLSGALWPWGVFACGIHTLITQWWPLGNGYFVQRRPENYKGQKSLWLAPGLGSTSGCCRDCNSWKLLPKHFSPFFLRSDRPILDLVAKTFSHCVYSIT